MNALMVDKVLDYLASGHTIKDVCKDYEINYNTLMCVFKRYRVRYGFRTTYQMVAARAVMKIRVRKQK